MQRRSYPRFVPPTRKPGGRLRAAALGAAAGAGFAVLCLGVGLLRAALALVGGTRIPAPSAGDVRLAAFYVGGFVAAGALVGLVGVERGGKVRGYATFMAGGAVVMLAITVAQKDGLRGLDGFDAVLVTLLGPLLGGAVANGWYRASP